MAEIQEHLRQRGPIRDYLPSKDTVIVTAAGYTVARILADNPGEESNSSFNFGKRLITMWKGYVGNYYYKGLHNNLLNVIIDNYFLSLQAAA